MKYIHNNPIKARLAEKIGDYKWSSHNFYLKGKSKEKWLDVDPELINFSSKRQQSIKFYKEFMEEKI